MIVIACCGGLAFYGLTNHSRQVVNATSKISKKSPSKKSTSHKKSSKSSKKSTSSSSESTVSSTQSTQADVSSSSQADQVSSEQESSNEYKTYTSYTTDGHKMVQTNDAGHYLGDPDVQYQTYQMMTEAANNNYQYSAPSTQTVNVAGGN